MNVDLLCKYPLIPSDWQLWKLLLGDISVKKVLNSFCSPGYTLAAFIYKIQFIQKLNFKIFKCL
jgi:hypothetical protein